MIKLAENNGLLPGRHRINSFGLATYMCGHPTDKLGNPLQIFYTAKAISATTRALQTQTSANMLSMLQ